MNLMIYGNSGNGKTTLAKLLTAYKYIHVNTGDITRLMASQDCHNLPVIVQAMVASMDWSKPHVFDHFYIHTYRQICRLTQPPVIVRLIDNRSVDHDDTPKRKRFVAQAPIIEEYFKAAHATIVSVYNTDYGFDVSELIKCGALPFDAFAVLGG